MADEDDDIYYGTPLPPLEENQNAPKKQELDLTVRDWKGRRRFHGAFTGGFSAGYYNTVSTEQGWIPSQFISTKSEKWDKQLYKSKPEDFMDDEDLSEFGIAPRKVQTKAKFKGPEDQPFAGFRDSHATISDVMRHVIKPANQSIGVRLYRLMKRGKRYKGEVIEMPKKIIGCQLPPHLRAKIEDRMETSDDEEADKPSYSVPYTPKNDLHGIDYVPLKSELLSQDQTSGPLTAVLSGNKRLKISGEAFGYGALEEDDDYGIETQVYSKDDLSNYDFAIGPVIKQKVSKPIAHSSHNLNSNNLDGFVKSSTKIILESQKDNNSIEIPKIDTSIPFASLTFAFSSKHLTLVNQSISGKS